MRVSSVLDLNIGDIEVRVAMNGFEYTGKKDSSTIHTHANFECHTALMGTACLETDKGIVTVKENDTLVIFPDTFHKFIAQDTDYAVLSFSFSVKKKERRSGSEYYSLIKERLDTSNDVLLIEGNSIIADSLKKIVAGYYSRRLFATDEKKALLTLVFVQLMSIFASMDAGEGRADIEAPEYDTRVYVIEEYFNEHYMENISLESLSEKLHLSQKQTDRIIRRAFGTGFREHLCKIRIESAKELLRDTDKSVKSVAEEVGYGSYNGFYGIFKSKTGEAPEEYRARKRTENPTIL